MRKLNLCIDVVTIIFCLASCSTISSSSVTGTSRDSLPPMQSSTSASSPLSTSSSTSVISIFSSTYSSLSEDSTTSSNTKVVSSLSRSVGGIFAFGESAEDFVKAAKAHKIKINAPQDPGVPPEITNPVNDGRIYQAYDDSYYYDLEGLQAYYNADDAARKIIVTSSAYATGLGLCVGNNYDKMVSLYGKGYVEISDEEYEYYDGTKYMTFSMAENVCCQWRIGADSAAGDMSE